jgi:hypothetical protein
MRTGPARRLLVVLLAAALFVACGDDDNGDATALDAGPLRGWQLIDAPRVLGAANPRGQLLPDGRVLLIGGNTTRVTVVSSDLRDADEVTPIMLSPEEHTVTRMPSGRFLAIGNISNEAETLMPFASPLGALYGIDGTQFGVEMADGRGHHQTALLPDGRALVIGGATGSTDGTRVEALARCELFDETTRTFTAAAPLAAGRYAHTATTLASGLIVVAGGRGDDGVSLTSVEIYDPATSAWRAAAPMHTARARHVAVLLGSGRVLVAGGTTGSPATVTATAELYDPATNTWATAPSMPIGVGAAGAAALPNGDAIVTGGFDRLDPLPLATRQALVFRDAASTWQAMGDMQTPHYDHSTVVLADGRVFVGVGWDRNPGFTSENLMEVSDDAFTAR